MAPRGRNKKAGLQRIDAAFDALIPFGFSKKIIRNTVRNLLEVYGGDEGWVFIEEASYKLLIDSILEQQEQDGNKDRNNIMQIKGEDVDDSKALEVSEPVVDAAKTSLYQEIISEGLQNGSGELAVPLGGVDECEDELPATVGDGSLSKLSVMAGDVNQSELTLMAGGTSNSSLHQPILDAIAGVAGSSSLEQPNEAPRTRRPPCYGWISESESE